MKKSKNLKRENVNLGNLAKLIEHEPAIIRIGKNGISETIISELKSLINKKSAIKIKLLRNAPIEDKKTYFQDLENRVGFKIIKIKGNTAIFIKESIFEID